MTRIGVVGTPLNHAPAPMTHPTLPNNPPRDRGDYGTGTYGGYGPDHTDYTHHFHPYSWQEKEKKKGPQGALNALTLLAFLFFLSILQNCFQDAFQASQQPTIVMMTTETTTDEGVRSKRDVSEDLLGETGALRPKTLSDRQISELVHNQVQSYWSNREARSVFTQIPDIAELSQLIPVHNHRQLKMVDDLQIYSFLNRSFLTNNLVSGFNGSDSNLPRDILYSKLNGPVGGETWWKIVSEPFFRRIFCSELCSVGRHEGNINDSGNSTITAIRHRLDWLCSPQELCRNL